MRRDGRTPSLVLCSRNARPEKGLVRRPHEDQHGCPSKKEKQASLEMSLMRTVKGSRSHSSKEKHDKLNDSRLVASLVSPIRLSRVTATDRSHPNMQDKVLLQPQ